MDILRELIKTYAGGIQSVHADLQGRIQSYADGDGRAEGTQLEKAFGGQDLGSLADKIAERIMSGEVGKGMI